MSKLEVPTMQTQRNARQASHFAFGILLVMSSVAGCSSRAVYDSIQLNERRECATLPPSQYDECIHALDKTYEEYRKEREVVIDE